MRNRATTPLRQVKIRQSWSKYNLYNLTRLRNPVVGNRTFFQQKWTAKSMARKYHGEQVRESQWERMFSRRLRTVVPMSPWKLAEDDGSGMAAGRGAGLELPSKDSNYTRETPYTTMTFAPLERRLDVAIFRALFASSARQARQFVVHGAVTVNGKKMRYPGYLLNPGDMFQVDPERVMFATGAPKDKFDRREARIERKKAEEKKEAEGEEGTAEESKESEPEAEPKENESEKLDTRKTLQGLLSQAKNLISKDKNVLPAKRKQELRGFQKAVRRVMSRSGASQSVLTDNLEDQFSELMTLLKAKKAETKGEKAPKESKESKKTDSDSPAASESKDTKDAEATDAAASENKPTEALTEAFRKAAENPEEEVDTSELTEEEFEVLKRALVQMRDNPIDSSKPYATPWRPRDYMSAFAFIPRYLEVNQNICAAVYLRHPVARPGYSEVPTPFSETVSTGAYHWYLRRR
ncbi:mitochondrial 37S ribosomal protein uS4m [Aspergillus lucknowensis]|uniref:RNA-binding S4 domain-containing protein n=1 Tax=Aspergillus lucknowensis TaxID=176173 RepID=A0ABR4LJH1_9EURO